MFKNFLLALCAVSSVTASRLVSEQIGVYRTILESIGKTEVDAEGILYLMSLFDGSPKYNKAAIDYISKKLGAEKLSWTMFEKVVDAIYGDQVSDDPFQPQEIHLALGNDITTMKVMWATMDNLQNPFVEFLPQLEDNWSLSTLSTAVNYTYSVEQKWWPTFTGVLYEADMDGLKADHRYKYRVGGWDTANNTMRFSDVFEFKAAPESNNPNRPTRIAAIADHGTFMLLGFATINKMVELKEKLGIEMVFAAGDLSYAGLSSAMPRLNISKEDEVRFLSFLQCWLSLFSLVVRACVGLAGHPEPAHRRHHALDGRTRQPREILQLVCLH